MFGIINKTQFSFAFILQIHLTSFAFCSQIRATPLLLNPPLITYQPSSALLSLALRPPPGRRRRARARAGLLPFPLTLTRLTTRTQLYNNTYTTTHKSIHMFITTDVCSRRRHGHRRRGLSPARSATTRRTFTIVYYDILTISCDAVVLSYSI